MFYIFYLNVGANGEAWISIFLLTFYHRQYSIKIGDCIEGQKETVPNIVAYAASMVSCVETEIIKCLRLEV